ncbi:hypothetical protein SEA_PAULODIABOLI_328 [Microbacterium phage PauloDiaboli]|nr:hypothetical protein SEA_PAULODIABOLI_328 [Microbacterium phage PauloDiaboli]
MQYMSVGALVPGRSRVIVEGWAMSEDGSSWLTLEPYEFHFEFRGLEEAIANYIGKQLGVNVTHMRFNIQGVEESDRTVLGTWTRTDGFSAPSEVIA